MLESLVTVDMRLMVIGHWAIDIDVACSSEPAFGFFWQNEAKISNVINWRLF